MEQPQDSDFFWPIYKKYIRSVHSAVYYRTCGEGILEGWLSRGWAEKSRLRLGQVSSGARPFPCAVERGSQELKQNFLWDSTSLPLR